jgi:predicted nucleotidyltransferase/uncharacterized protein YdcH (DUF465 family)
MEIHIKKTIRAGNSSAVVLPKSWLNREVRVELVKKSEKTILLESLEIMEKHILLKEIIGVYIVGSYARKEENLESDIDILVVTKDMDKEMVNEGNYNILIVSNELLNQKLKSDLFPLGQMIKEAKPLINSEFLNSLKVNVTKNNVAWYLKTTKDKIKLVDKVLNNLRRNGFKNIDSRVTYTLVLRIRTMHIIKKLLNNEIYSKEEFINLIKKVSKSDAPYERYLDVKNNLDKKIKSNIGENEMLLDYLKKELKLVVYKLSHQNSNK